ncbi:1-deoxy-D-xylulose-5-phosphate reductoisomerase [Fodinicurvata halophila]|uniref:1-deoxy-D-xylulose 5-phosphate reductoisomerase n=1 Tax=Fodinicurvata halophila TaxID=1419723 RepID=A0ABV8UKD4_9PROT
MKEPRRIAILGSTGSVGQSTLELISQAPEHYRVEALSAYRSVEQLAAQARACSAAFAAVGDPSLYKELKEALSGTETEVAAGPEALVEAAARDSDWVMAAIVGAAGLPATLEAVRRGAMVALANKESLVCAGAYLVEAARASGATLLPVDSEHNAIFQVFAAEQKNEIEEIILTASGGPFRTWSSAEMETATPEQALAHPNWSMGAKISIDSATMMNKGLELIEAVHLFDLPDSRVSVVVHPQSIVHGLVRYSDGSLLAQMGHPDMRTPIAHSLAWPARMNAPVKQLSLTQMAQLTFQEPEDERFPALRLARDSLRNGTGATIVFNAANEVAVEGFLAHRLGFMDIPRVVADTLEAYMPNPPESFEAVLEIDREAREHARAGLGQSKVATG